MEAPLTEQQYFRQYYQDNQEKYRATANAYYHKNRERLMTCYREYYAQWYEANKDWVNASRREKRKQLSTPSVQRKQLSTPSVQRKQLSTPSVQRNVTLSFDQHYKLLKDI